MVELRRLQEEQDRQEAEERANDVAKRGDMTAFHRNLLTELDSGVNVAERVLQQSQTLAEVAKTEVRVCPRVRVCPCARVPRGGARRCSCCGGGQDDAAGPTQPPSLGMHDRPMCFWCTQYVPERRTAQERHRRQEQAQQVQDELTRKRAAEAAAEAAEIAEKYARKTTADAAADARARYLARKQAAKQPLPTLDDE